MKFYGTPLLYVFLSGYTYFASIILNYISIWNEIGLGATWVEETLINVLDLLDFYEKKGIFLYRLPMHPVIVDNSVKSITYHFSVQPSVSMKQQSSISPLNPVWDIRYVFVIAS